LKEALQEAMLDMPQVDIRTTHSFCDGIYAREISIPEGVVLVGAKHKTEFFIVISKGECAIYDDEVENYYSAPCTLVSPVGAKRVIYAIKDTILTTFHPTNEVDVSKIEAEIIEPEGLKIANNAGGAKCLG
jgi:hypothetical protein